MPERLQRIIGAALSNISEFVYVFDRQGRFVYVNDALLNLWGLTLEQAQGRTFHELPYPTDLATLLQAQIQQVFATGEKLVDETPYVSPTGIDGVYEYIFYPTYSEAGEIEFVAGCTRDITARKRIDDHARMILEAITDAYFAIDRDWKITFANSQALRLLNLENETTLGHSLWNLFPGLEDTDFGRAYFQTMDKGVSTVVTAYYPDHSRWYEARTFPSSQGIVIYFRDVTEHELREAEQRQSLENSAKFHAMFEQSTQFAGILSTEGSVIEVNRLALDCGYSREEVVGRPFWECGWWNQTPEVQAAIRTSVESAAQGTVVQIQTPYYLSDGTSRDMNLMITPVMDAAGSVLYLAPTGHDITDRLKTERSLLQSQEEKSRQRALYEAILDNTPDFAYVFDLQRRFIYLNEPLLEMWGRTWDDSIGRTFLENGYEPWHAEMHEREIDQVVSTKMPIRGEVPFTGTFGRRHYDYIFVPVFDDAGEVVAVAGTTRDVTDSRQNQEELEAADRRKDEFLALLAHELRNPLAPIANATELLKICPPTPENLAPIQEMIERQLGHMIRLVDDLLDVSRISRGKIDLNLEVIDLGTLIKHCEEAFLPSAQHRGLTFQSRHCPAPITITGDRTRLSQIVGNLLNNACKFTPPGGTITLTTEIANDWAMIRVSDSGIGLEPDQMGRIFDLFAQVEDALDRTQSGLGIGLTIVRQLVEMHGGTIDVQSNGLGSGSQFQVRLPLAIASESWAPKALDPAAPAPARRILVVDDNQDSAASLAEVLRRNGHTVEAVFDGHEAINIARTFLPDVVFLDIGMPGLNGYQVAAELQTFSPATLVAMTGWGQAKDLQLSREAGFVAHLVKPVNLNEIQKILTDSKIDLALRREDSSLL